MNITGKAYDRLKYLAQIILPALGTLYFTLASIWGLPAAQEVVGTIVAVDTFLGVVLQLSSNNYNKSDAKFDGEFQVSNGLDGPTTVQPMFKQNLPELVEKGEVTLKVVKEPPPAE